VSNTSPSQSISLRGEKVSPSAAFLRVPLATTGEDESEVRLPEEVLCVLGAPALGTRSFAFCMALSVESFGFHVRLRVVHRPSDRINEQQTGNWKIC